MHTLFIIVTSTVLITGSSSGIGRATARLFAQKGWNVLATMRRPEKETELTQLENVAVTRLDVQDRSSIDAAVRFGLERFGAIDTLVNNAGYGQYGLFEAVPREKVQEQFDVNLFGVMDVTRAVLPHFRARHRGTIVNVSSGAGIFTLPMLSLYCASKFALEGFSEALSYELASQKITVKLVIPHGGVLATNFGRRTAQGQADTVNLDDYGAFAERTQQAFEGMAAQRSIGASQVAEKIFQAATDGTDNLRYLIGDDPRGFLKARYQMREEDYTAFMRLHFVPRA